MKILLTFFVLFFSTSLIASNDLTDKKVFCSGKNELDFGWAAGIAFQTKSKLRYWRQNSESDKRVYHLTYLTTPTTIKINNKMKNIFDINRKNLKITYFERAYSIFDFKEGECKLTETHPGFLINEFFKDITDENIL